MRWRWLGGKAKRNNHGADGSLCGAKPGAYLRISSIPRHLSCAQRLRELGIIEGGDVLLLRQSDPVLVLAKRSRIAIDRATAAQIATEEPGA